MLTAEFQSYEPWPILVVHLIGGGSGGGGEDGDDPMNDCIIMCATSTGKS